MLYLKIGCKNDNGSVEIIDEDKLCYKVKSSNHGAMGIRTISKALLEEFVAFEKDNPNATAIQARNALTGISDIDKFEYGYNATLWALTKLNKEIEIKIATNFKCILEYFCTHLSYIVTNDKTVKGYSQYLESYVNSGTFKKAGQGWNGGNIQKQIEQWAQFDFGTICINVYGMNFQGYATYLNWKGTGHNIVANWKDNIITSLQLVEYKEFSLNHWEEQNVKYSLGQLGLYDGITPNNNLISFFEKFVEMLNKKEAIDANNDFINRAKQIIYYGAPGTGKSHDIDFQTKGHSVVRTTFHPDSDYSTFVGAYKPTMNTLSRKKQDNLSIEDLALILKTYYQENEYGNIAGIQKFVYEYQSYLNGDISIVNIAKLLQSAGISNNYQAEISKYIKFCKLIPKQTESKIVYKFVKQAFLKAYLSAWKKYVEGNMTLVPNVKPQFLVIEEINRGNCAQIFGDIFQLLDRGDNMFSCYPIEVDTDIQNEIANAFANEEEYKLPDFFNVDSAIENYTSNYGLTLSEDIRQGHVMLLPPNLYIWATMNTSDQSLFPIDSAFKRRWCMKYVPINPYKENWAIEVGDRKYSWSSFLEKVNYEIGQTTMSEDKKLGFYFCKADKKADETDDKPTIITLENFASKVLFYIYNDVFKDYGLEREFFKDKENDQKIISFESLFDYQGEIKDSVVAKILDNLEVGLMEEEYSNNEDSPRQGGKTHSTCKRVEFPDGTSFEDDNYTQAEILTETISKVGLDRVYDIIGSINIHVDGIYNVVSKEIQDGCVKKPTTIGEYYIYPPAGSLCCSFIKKINDKLNLGLIITEK